MTEDTSKKGVHVCIYLHYYAFCDVHRKGLCDLKKKEVKKQAWHSKSRE